MTLATRFSRAYGHRLHVFPRLALATHFPALGSGYMLSRASHRPSAFLAPAKCFPRLARVIVCLFFFLHWVPIGLLGYPRLNGDPRYWKSQGYGDRLLEKQSSTNVITLVLVSQVLTESSCQPCVRIRLVRKNTSCTETLRQMKYSSQELLDPRILFLALHGENCHGCKKKYLNQKEM